MAKLYLISSPSINLEDFIPKLEACLATGQVGLFQLRLKPASDEEVIEASEKLIPVCRKYNTPFILNDSFQLAKQVGADGVHLGEESEEYEEARKALGNLHIGISCYADFERAKEFAKKGADLVSIGQFYPTKTKPPKGMANLEFLKKCRKEVETSISVIGGLTPERAKPLAEAGADYICVVSYVWDSENPADRVLDFNLA